MRGVRYRDPGSPFFLGVMLVLGFLIVAAITIKAQPIGIAAFLAGIIYWLVVMLSNEQHIPERFMFNNAKGRLEVVMPHSGGQLYIPYHDLVGIEVHRYKYDEVSNKRRVERVAHAIYAKQKNGNVWFLYYSNDVQQTATVYDELMRSVKLDAPAQLESSRSNRKSVKITPTTRGYDLRWKRTVGFVPTLIFVLFCVLLILLPATMILDMARIGSQDPGGWVLAFVAGFILLVVLVVVRFTVLTEYGLLVREKDFVYFSRMRWGGTPRKLDAVASKDAAHVIYSFAALPGSQFGGSITVLTQEELASLPELERQYHRPLSESFPREQKPFSLSVSGISAIEGYQMAQWLQAQLQKQAGRA